MSRDMDVVRLTVELSELMLPGCELPAPNVRLLTRGGGTTMMPYFFACRNGADLFICVRGAAEPADFLLVLDFERETFQDGQIHRGVARAARWIIAQCRRFIDECRGRIICCGHSLGGASAGMIAALLSLEERRQNVIGICQAPFPILTQNLARRLENMVTSFVYRGDIVPRLSAANTATIVRMLTAMMPDPNQAAVMVQGIVWQMIQGIMSMNPYGLYNAQMAAAMQAQLPGVVQRLVRSTQIVEPHEFVLPGRAYLLGSHADGNPSVRLYTAADATFNIATLITAITDHNGECYKDVIFMLEALE
jgi:pimeloyl-ACP methyl ester carboxylesterase